MIMLARAQKASRDRSSREKLFRFVFARALPWKCTPAWKTRLCFSVFLGPLSAKRCLGHPQDHARRKTHTRALTRDCRRQRDRTNVSTTPVGFEPTQGDPIGLAGRRLSHSAKVS